METSAYMSIDKSISLFSIAESAKRIPDTDNVSGHKGTELLRTPVEVKSGDWSLKVVPWIGGRIISMEHLPSSNAYKFYYLYQINWDLSFLFLFKLSIVIHFLDIP